MRFAQGGAEAMHRNWGPDFWSRHWHLAPGETLAGVLADNLRQYAEQAAARAPNRIEGAKLWINGQSRGVPA